MGGIHVMHKSGLLVRLCGIGLVGDEFARCAILHGDRRINASRFAAS